MTNDERPEITRLITRFVVEWRMNGDAIAANAKGSHVEEALMNRASTFWECADGLESSYDELEAALRASQQAYAICEAHQADKWEGDGTCVICEGQRLADEAAALRASQEGRDLTFIDPRNGLRGTDWDAAINPMAVCDAQRAVRTDAGYVAGDLEPSGASQEGRRCSCMGTGPDCDWIPASVEACPVHGKASAPSEGVEKEQK
jgi:hypothetical protein